MRWTPKRERARRANGGEPGVDRLACRSPAPMVQGVMAWLRKRTQEARCRHERTLHRVFMIIGTWNDT